MALYYQKEDIILISEHFKHEIYVLEFDINYYVKLSTR